MSFIHYISAPYELDLGSFGDRKTEIHSIEIINPKLIRVNENSEIQLGFPMGLHKTIGDLKNDLVVYETEIDAAGIYIPRLCSERGVMKVHFSNKYIYEVSANIGHFVCNDDCSEINKKCIDSLIEYISDRIHSKGFIEFYTCWEDEEDKARNKELDTEIYLDNAETVSNFRVIERQYVKFFKSKKE